MADSTLVAMKGIIARLKATSDITDIVAQRIYSSIPQQEAFPYIEVEIESRDWSQQDDANMQHLVRVHCYSRTNSLEQAATVTEKVYNSLNRQENSITIDTGSVVVIQFDGVKTTFKEQDGVTWHSVIEFNLIID